MVDGIDNTLSEISGLGTKIKDFRTLHGPRAARTVGNGLETLSKCLNMISTKFGIV